MESTLTGARAGRSSQNPGYPLANGAERVIRRTLTRDYARGRTPDCESVFTIDGDPATEVDLAACGCVLSPPPLRAPVLAQHTLGYLFSARAQDRAEYFRALLKVTDLEELRSAIAGLETETRIVETAAWTKFAAACAVTELGALLSPFRDQVPATAALHTAFDEVPRR